MGSEAIEDAVAKATPKELVGMMYDQAVRDLRGAMELFSITGDPRSQTGAVRLIIHAQQVVAALDRSLDLRSGAVAKNLARLYEYAQYRLTEAISTRSKEPVAEVLDLLSRIGSAWKSAPEIAAAADRVGAWGRRPTEKRWARKVLCDKCGVQIDELVTPKMESSAIAEALTLCDSRMAHRKQTGCPGGYRGWLFGPWEERDADEGGPNCCSRRQEGSEACE
jgi:flagellar biosynthetic protein FliS